MQSIFTNDSYEAFKTGNGIVIQTRSKGALKMSVIAIALGLAFIAISFIDTTKFYSDINSTFAKLTQSFFYYAFRWGGILMVAIGILLLVFKGASPKTETIELDAIKREFRLKGKTTPFSELGELVVQAQPMLGKTMTVMMFNNNGKKKAFVPPSFTKDSQGFENFANEIRALIKN